MGGLRKCMPITVRHLHHRLAGHRGHPALRRLLVEGRHPGRGLAQEPGAVGRRVRHRRAHRLLHEPPGRPGLLRRGPLAGAASRPRPTAMPAGDAEPWPDGGRRPRRGTTGRRAPRVALDHDRPAGRARRLASPSAGCSTCPSASSTSSTGGSSRSCPPPSRPTPTSPPASRWPWPCATTVLCARRPGRSACVPWLRSGRAARAGAGRPRATPGTSTTPSPPSWAVPATTLADFTAYQVDKGVIDGAVNGVARLTASRRPAAAQAADRLRPQLRPRAWPAAPRPSCSTWPLRGGS